MGQKIEDIDCVLELKSQVPTFLDRLKGKRKDGFFHYSLFGDLHMEDENWGLGNSIFAAKIYYTLDMVLLLWGIAILSQILGIDRELGFKEFIP